MQNFLAIVVPFQKGINEQASTFDESVEKMSILAGFCSVFQSGTSSRFARSDGKNLPLPRNCYVNWKMCGVLDK
jgi:hypothetical protein